MKCGCILRTILMKSCHGGGGVSGVNGSGERRKKRFKYDNFPRSFFFVSFCDATVCRLERTRVGRGNVGSRSRT